MTQTRELFTEDDLAILFVAYQSALNANATTEANAINSLRERIGSWIAEYRWPSESPTHPDAPRAGGETPTLLGPERVEMLRKALMLGRMREPCYSSSIVVTADELEALLNAWTSLLERHRDGEWENASSEDLTGARWYCEHCDAWGTVEIVRLPQLDAENLVCLKCRYQVAAFIPAPKHDAAVSAPPSPERAPHD